jgi:hypothetical protein
MRTTEISPPRKSPLESLPTEMLLHITSFLNNDDEYDYAAMLSLASKSLRGSLGDTFIKQITSSAGAEIRDHFLHILTKDSVIYYQCVNPVRTEEQEEGKFPLSTIAKKPVTKYISTVSSLTQIYPKTD